MNFIPDTSVQLPGETTFTSSTDKTNLSEWTKSGINLYNSALGNVSIGTTSTIYKLNVNGSINFVTLYENGNLIDFTLYATKSLLTSGLATKQDKINAYVLQTGSIGSLGFLAGTLTLTLPNNYSSLSISSLTTDTNFIYKGTELTTTLNAKQPNINTYTITGASGGSLSFASGTGTLTLAMPNNYIGNISLSNLITPTSFIYKGTELSTSLNAKEAILTFNSPLTRTINAIGIDLSSYYTQTQVNGLITGSSNYTTNASNALKTNIDANNTTINTAIGNTSNYALNISNILTTRDATNLSSSSNYSLNISNALKTNIDANNTATSNYALNISNALKTNIDANNTNTSNYALNISNILTTRDATNLSSSSNYSLNISNALKTNIDANNTATSNYALNISNILTTRDATNLSSSSNYSLNISNILKANIDTNNINTSNYASNVSNVLWTNVNTNFLKLSGGSMTGQITGVTTLNGTTGIFGTLATTNNTNTGLPETGVNGAVNGGDKIILYAGGVGFHPYSIGIAPNNLWYSAVAGASHNFYIGGGNPKMTILSNGNVGIGTSSPGVNLHLYASAGNNAIQSLDASAGSGLAILRLISGNGSTNRGTFLDFYNNVASTTYPRWRIVNDYDYNGTNDLRIINGNIQSILTILQNGNVGINVLNPSQILQVGNAGRLRIANGTGDYSILGTIDNDGPLNTRIVVSGNTRGGIYSGNIDYVATAGGSHIFYTTDSTTETMRLTSSSLRTSVINLTTSASGNNVLYIKSTNTGANNCIQIQNNNNITAYIGVGGGGFGGNYANNFFIESANGAIILNTQGRISTSTPNFLINSSGNIETSGEIRNGATSYMYAGGLRINGNDPNTLYNESRVLGFTALNSINFATGTSLANYATRMSINTSGNLTLQVDTWIYSSDSSRQRIYFGNIGRTIYQGYGNTSVLDINHEWRNHNGDVKMSLDFTGNLRIRGNLVANFLTIANTGRDLTGISIEGTNTNDRNDAVLYCIQGTFTGFHRVYTEDENFNIEDPQKFKDDYEGRIVVSTGKIATDTTDSDNKDNTEWRILQDKEGITIEDALFMVELSRKRKDKRVVGVLGDKRRSNNRPERLIINSVGEGAVWIINSAGNFENGDLITSSDYLGYGELQDSEFITNYTCGKITMDCSFELDSPLYQCKEIEEYNENNEKLRVAFVACVYYCG